MKPFYHFSLQSSQFEYLILLLRSTIKAASLWITPQASRQPLCPSTHHWRNLPLAAMVKYKQHTSAPFVFRDSSFCKLVVTHSLANSDFHGHRPAINMNQHLLWNLGERILWRFILIFGSSQISIPAYTVCPTNNQHSTQLWITSRTKDPDCCLPQCSIHKQIKKYDWLATGFLRLPFRNFKYSLTLFSEFFASFPHGTCALLVSEQCLALDEFYHLLYVAIPNNMT